MKTLLTLAAAFMAGSGIGMTTEAELYRFDFEGSLTNDWLFPKGDSTWRIESGVGRNGSRALVWDHSVTNTRPLVRVGLGKFVPGMIVEAEAWVKIEKYEGEGSPSYDIEWNDLNGKWCAGAGPKWHVFPPKTKREQTEYVAPERDHEGWHRLVFTTPLMESDAAKPMLQFFVPKTAKGRVYYDDIVLRVVEERHVTCFANSAYQGRAFKGVVTFAAGICCDPNDVGRGELEFRGSNGKARKVSVHDITNLRATVSVPVADFAMGMQKVTFRMFSSKGRILGEADVPFTRTKGPDLRKVAFDAQERCLVNGKPFFPIGMYWHEGDFRKRPELLDHYATGPFNCLQSYDPEITTADLDAFWRKGLRVIPSLIKYYAKNPDDKELVFFEPSRGIKDKADEIRAVTAHVNALKDHPALLAWYVCDEMPLRWLSRFKERTDLIRALDPEHPQFACFCKDTISGPMINCYDVMGLDIYSICPLNCPKRELLPDCANVWRATKCGMTARAHSLGLRPMWQVPQAFCWRWDYPEHPELRFPTAKEFRAMCWQHVAIGANGLIMYAYGQMLKDWGKPDFETNWRTVTEAATEVKAHVPILLKDPWLAPDSCPEGIVARTWKDRLSVYVLVCNVHTEPCKGELRIPGVGVLRKTLINGGVSAGGGKLLLDMQPLGVGLVELSAEISR